MTDWQRSRQRSNERVQEYLKYSGMAIEMMAIIGIFTFIGFKIDQLLKIGFPISIILGVLIGLSVALYRIMKGLEQK